MYTVPCDPQRMSAREVLLPCLINDKTKLREVKRVFCFHKTSSWCRTLSILPQPPLLSNLGYIPLRRNTGRGGVKKMKRNSLQVRAGQTYWVCKLFPWSPVRNMPDGDPGTSSGLGHRTKIYSIPWGKYRCSAGHQCLVNTSPLISLSPKLGVGKENMISFIEHLLYTGHYTRSFPNSKLWRHWVASFYSDIEVTLMTGEVKCPAQGHTHRKPVSERSEPPFHSPEGFQISPCAKTS